MKSQRHQAGFTLIELIAVIVILGILAAVALPKFADMSANARISKVSGAAGAIRSAVAISHSAWLAAGTSPATITLEGHTITMTNGYPDASSIVVAAGLSPDYGIPTTTTSPITIGADAAHTTGCSVTYTNATTTAAPDVTTSLGSCG